MVVSHMEDYMWRHWVTTTSAAVVPNVNKQRSIRVPRHRKNKTRAVCVVVFNPTLTLDVRCEIQVNQQKHFFTKIDGRSLAYY